jgi:site-specific recombinase XerC
MGLLAANPCDALERPRTVPSIARGYSADEVRRLLAAVPDTLRGRRDRAILLVLVLTGRRGPR